MEIGDSKWVLRKSVVFGLWIGAMWTGQAVLGYLGGSVLSGFRSDHFSLYRVLTSLCVLLALGTTQVIGFWVAYRTGRWKPALYFGAGSGAVSGVMAALVIVTLTILFRSQLSETPTGLVELTPVGVSGATNVFKDALMVAAYQLAVALAVGVILGSLGGFAGKYLRIAAEKNQELAQPEPRAPRRKR